MEKSENVRRQDERTGRQALTDDGKGTMMMNMCRVHLERHLALTSDRYGASPKVKSATRNYLEQMSRKPYPKDIDEMAYPGEEHEG